MGGGTSSIQGVENLLATTVMLGRAIAAITFPGMFRLYDFHSKKAPKLKNAMQSYSLFGYVSDDDDENDTPDVADPAVYEKFFHVKVGEDNIYIEDPLYVNESGWMALHSCCMSLSTVEAGLKLIDEIVGQGGNLNQKTLAGPGSFNKGWTPLHMACAYGIEDLAEKLVNEGADVNTTNAFGFTPLYEASHRGFLGVVNILIKSKRLNLSYIPDVDKALESPFITSPPQSALGEAARVGLQSILQVLLDAGCDKNLRNSLGWTPLHEACFYNRYDCVKVLLLRGADSSIRTNIGALPYHLAGMQVIKTMLIEMGGPTAEPKNGDNIDMMMIFRELAMAPQTAVMTDSDGNVSVIRFGEPNISSEDVTSRNGSDSSQAYSPSAKQIHNKPSITDSNDFKDEKTTFLHTGPVLGNLPSLPNGMTSPKSKASSRLNDTSSQDLDMILDNSNNKNVKFNQNPSKRADEKKPKKKKTNQRSENVPDDIPPKYLCQLTQRPMTQPVKSSYGHIYDKSAIFAWLNQHGRICPMTGAPLSETNLQPLEDLESEIREWVIKRSTGTLDTSSQIPSKEPDNVTIPKKSKENANDDLYDF